MSIVRAIRCTAWRHSSEHGAAAVELAILLPVFLAITLAAVDFGLAYRQQLMLHNAASNAANYASVQPCDTAGTIGFFNGWNDQNARCSAVMTLSGAFALVCIDVAAPAGQGAPILIHRARASIC